jgi:hypothetical protein
LVANHGMTAEELAVLVGNLPQAQSLDLYRLDA